MVLAFLIILLGMLRLIKKPPVPKGREAELTWYHPCRAMSLPMQVEKVHRSTLMRYIGRPRNSLLYCTLQCFVFQPFCSEGRFRASPYRLAPSDDSLKLKLARTSLVIALLYHKGCVYNSTI